MKKEMPKIDINDINKVRKQALRWTKRIKESKLLKWESLPYYCMRIGRCMRKLGFSYNVYEVTTFQGIETVHLELCYTVEEPRGACLIHESANYELDKKGKFATLGLAAQCIVDCCQQLADYLYERPTPQPLP